MYEISGVQVPHPPVLGRSIFQPQRVGAAQMTPVWHGHKHCGSREEPTELRDSQEALIFPYTVRSKSITFVSAAF